MEISRRVDSHPLKMLDSDVAIWSGQPCCIIPVHCFHDICCRSGPSGQYRSVFSRGYCLGLDHKEMLAEVSSGNIVGVSSKPCALDQVPSHSSITAEAIPTMDRAASLIFEDTLVAWRETKPALCILCTASSTT